MFAVPMLAKARGFLRFVESTAGGKHGRNPNRAIASRNRRMDPGCRFGVDLVDPLCRVAVAPKFRPTPAIVCRSANWCTPPPIFTSPRGYADMRI